MHLASGIPKARRNHKFIRERFHVEFLRTLADLQTPKNSVFSFYDYLYDEIRAILTAT